MSEHWTNGGTGITNFNPTMLDVYQKAINEHPGLGLWIEKRPMSGPSLKGDYSLHRHATGDLSLFWETFERIKEDTCH